MKHVKYKPDFSSWSFDVSPSAEKQIAEAIHDALSDDDVTWASLPVLWGDNDGAGGPAVDDPLTVYVKLGLDSDGEPPIYSESMTDLINQYLSDFSADGSFKEGLERLSAALRAMADKIDQAITPPTT